MKIYFANVYGETVKHDIQLTVPYALVESGEESLALSQGFYKTYWDYPGDHFFEDFADTDQNVWLQARLGRITSQEYKPGRTTRAAKRKYLGNELTYRISKPADLSETDKFKLHATFFSYIKFKGYSPEADVQTIFGYQEYFKNFMISHVENRRIIMFYYKSDLIAFSCFEIFGDSIFGCQFAWNYRHPKLSLGKMQISFIHDYALKNDIKYIYLGLCYGKQCVYKAGFKSFEYWTGKDWLNDKDRYIKMCESDSAVQSLDDLEDLLDSNFTTLWGTDQPYQLFKRKNEHQR
tara:strand:+ start:24006 stop:24881 length:876 start_codon:yes stop_codon:yes gene_type:complete